MTDLARQEVCPPCPPCPLAPEIRGDNGNVGISLMSPLSPVSPRKNGLPEKLSIAPALARWVGVNHGTMFLTGDRGDRGDNGLNACFPGVPPIPEAEGTKGTRRPADTQTPDHAPALADPLALVATWPPDLREAFEERAGIMEFDGGLTRHEAELAAYQALEGEARAAASPMSRWATAGAEDDFGLHGLPAKDQARIAAGHWRLVWRGDRDGRWRVVAEPDGAGPSKGGPPTAGCQAQKTARPNDFPKVNKPRRLMTGCGRGSACR